MMTIILELKKSDEQNPTQNFDGEEVLFLLTVTNEWILGYWNYGAFHSGRGLIYDKSEISHVVRLKLPNK